MRLRKRVHGYSVITSPCKDLPRQKLPARYPSQVSPPPRLPATSASPAVTPTPVTMRARHHRRRPRVVVSSGRLTRVEPRPSSTARPTHSSTRATPWPTTSAISRDEEQFTTLAPVRMVSPQGEVSALTLPASIPGATAAPPTSPPLARLRRRGPPLRPRGTTHQRQRRLFPPPPRRHRHPGAVREAHRERRQEGTGDVHDPVDATRFPCALPRTLTYHAGQLILADEKSYVVRLPASQG